MHSGRSQHSVAHLGRYVYVVGGVVDGNTIVHITERYNMIKDKWVELHACNFD